MTNPPTPTTAVQQREHVIATIERAQARLAELPDELTIRAVLSGVTPRLTAALCLAANAMPAMLAMIEATLPRKATYEVLDEVARRNRTAGFCANCIGHSREALDACLTAAAALDAALGVQDA